MHPPRIRPPSKTTANPLTAIVFLVFPVAISDARIIVPTPQLTEKTAPMLRFWRGCDHLPVGLLQECRSAPMRRNTQNNFARNSL
ncbi:MAG: hypothetical protein WCD30_16610, partial [Pseudolabrys sp.]